QRARAGGAHGGRPAADAVRALVADRGGDHAGGTDRPVAAGAGDARLPVRMPVAARHGGLWWLLLVRHGGGAVPSRMPAGPSRSYGWEGPDGSPGRPLISGPRQLGRFSTVTVSITTSCSGRSVRGSVCVVAMLSTTRLPSSVLTAPKMVCFPVSQVVGATVMKNWEPLVPVPFGPGQALAIASRYGRVNARSGWISSPNW